MCALVAGTTKPKGSGSTTMLATGTCGVAHRWTVVEGHENSALQMDQLLPDIVAYVGAYGSKAPPLPPFFQSALQDLFRVIAHGPGERCKDPSQCVCSSWHRPPPIVLGDNHCWWLGKLREALRAKAQTASGPLQADLLAAANDLVGLVDTFHGRKHKKHKCWFYAGEKTHPHAPPRVPDRQTRSCADMQPNFAGCVWQILSTLEHGSRAEATNKSIKRVTTRTLVMTHEHVRGWDDLQYIYIHIPLQQLVWQASMCVAAVLEGRNATRISRFLTDIVDQCCIALKVICQHLSPALALARAGKAQMLVDLFKVTRVGYTWRCSALGQQGRTSSKNEAWVLRQLGEGASVSCLEELHPINCVHRSANTLLGLSQSLRSPALLSTNFVDARGISAEQRHQDVQVLCEWVDYAAQMAHVARLTCLDQQLKADQLPLTAPCVPLTLNAHVGQTQHALLKHEIECLANMIAPLYAGNP